MNRTLRKIITASLLASASAYATGPVAQKRLKLTDLDKEGYSHKVGDLYYTPQFRAGVGYQENSNRAVKNTNEDDGFFSEVALNLDLHKDIFNGLTLTTDFEIGYKQGFQDNEKDGFLLSAGSGAASEIGFDHDLNEKTTLSLVNYASVGIDRIETARDNAGSDDLHLWQNNISLQVHREITDDTGFGVRVGYETTRDLENNNPDKEFDEVQFGLTLDHQASARILLSPYFNYYEREWEEASNDSETYELGLSTDILVSDQVDLNIRVAYYEKEYDSKIDKKNFYQTPMGLMSNEASRSEEGFNFGLTFNHIATEKFTHSLELAKEMMDTTVISANATEVVSVSYNARYEINEKLSVMGSFSWLNGEDQVDLGEEFDIYKPSFSVMYDFTPRQSIKFTYSYEDKNSDRDDADGKVFDNEYETSLYSIDYTYSF